MADTPDAIPLWNAILTGASGMLAWGWKQLWDGHKSNEQQIASTREMLLRDYVPKAELLPRLDKIDEKLDRLIEIKKGTPR